jgi:hypothetical protein
MSEFKEVNEIIIRVVGPTKAGKTAVASLVDNALRASGVQAKVESDSSLSYLREAKNFVPNNIQVRLIDGDGGANRDTGLFDALIPIKGRIKHLLVRVDQNGLFNLYRVEKLSGVELNVWVGDFNDVDDAEEAALSLGNKYDVSWTSPYTKEDVE